MPRRKLAMTPAWVAGVKPAPTPLEYRDREQPGLVLRVETSGRKTWVARYTVAGRARRFTLGPFPAVTLKAARKAARTTIGKAASGTDPQLEKERIRVGQQVGIAIAAWLADTKHGPAARWKGGLTGGTARGYLSHVRRFAKEMHATRLTELTPQQLERFVTRPAAAATRNRAVNALRGFFAWCKRKGLLDADPSAALGTERETARTRVLTEGELEALIHGCDATRYGRAVRLLALTGLRRDEVLNACWTWLDAKAGILTIPPEAEKTGRVRGEPRRVALSPQAIALLAAQRKAQFAEGIRSDYIFSTSTGECPARGVLKPTIYRLRGRRGNGLAASTDKRAKPRQAALTADVTLRDVRRTVANTLLNTLAAAPWVVNHVVLGHARPKLLRTYMPELPLDDARAALTRWADELARILGEGEQADVG